MTGDFDGDGKSDIALVGSAATDSITIAFARGGNTFEVREWSAPGFVNFVHVAQTRLFVGDFDGDGKSDLAVAGGVGWNSVPLALSRLTGNFEVHNDGIPSVANAAASTTSTIVAVDLDGDRKDDLVVFGDGAVRMTYAHSVGDGSFANAGALAGGDFGVSALEGPKWAWAGSCGRTGGASPCSFLLFGGHVNSEGGTPWTSVVFGALPSASGGTVASANDMSSGAELVTWTQASFQYVAGDFDGDGAGDVAVFAADSVPGTLKTAYTGPGGAGARFPVIARTRSMQATNFVALAGADGAVAVSGDFDGDAKTDIALVGAAGWQGIYVARSIGDGTFTTTPIDLPGFAAAAAGRTGQR